MDNCFIKNNQEILLDLADFSLQEQPQDNLMVAISWAWYNGSYTMVAKPIKSVEFHYTITQYLSNTCISIMRKCVSSDIQTLRNRLKKRRTAELFLNDFEVFAWISDETHFRVFDMASQTINTAVVLGEIQG